MTPPTAAPALAPAPVPAGRGWRRAAILAVAPLGALLTGWRPELAALVVLLGIAVAAIEVPFAVLLVWLFAHMATPAYLRIPVPGDLFDPPISTGIYLLLIGVGLARALAGRRAPAMTPQSRRVLGLFLLLGAIAGTSLINPRTTAEGVEMWIKATVFPAIAMVAVVALGETRARLEAMFLVIMAGAMAASVYGIYEQVIGYNPLIDAYGVDLPYFRSEVLGNLAYRSFSVYGNPIEYSTTVGMAAVYPMVRFAAARDARTRLMFGFAILLCYAGVLVSFSRGPLLALVAVTIGVGLIYRSMRPWLTWAAVAGALSVAALWPFIGAGVSDRLRDVENVTLRLKLWETAVAIFQDHPVRGVGIGNFPQYYLEWLRLHRIGPFYEFGEDSVERIRVAEQTYLQLAAETGMLGVAAAVAFATALGALGFRLVRAGDERSRDLAIAALGGSIVWSISGLFITAYTHFFCSMLAIGVFPAIIFALDALERPERSAAAPASPGDIETRQG